jgi:hypothetical protein
MSCCPVCDLKGNEVVRGPDRLRGFEIELSASAAEGLGDKKLCLAHLSKCDGRCQLKQSKEICNCKICVREAQTATAKKLVCPGHPCWRPELGRASEYLAGLVIGSGIKTTGSFENWRRTPRDNNYWDLKTDSSCGYEIATPPWTGEAAERELRKGLAPLVELERMHPGWKVQDDRCGLHCTIDVGDQGLRGIKRILLLAARHQSALLGTQPRYRWNNINCRKFGEAWLGTVGSPGFKRRVTYLQTMDGLREIVPEKYFLVNTKKFQDGEGLLEFRFGGASVQWERVAAYGVLVECLVQAAIERPVVVETGDRKKRLYKEIIEPYIKDRRVQAAWEGVLWPMLADVSLPVDPKAPPKRAIREVLRERGL